MKIGPLDTSAIADMLVPFASKMTNGIMSHGTLLVFYMLTLITKGGKHDIESGCGVLGRLIHQWPKGKSGFGVSERNKYLRNMRAARH